MRQFEHLFCLRFRTLGTCRFHPTVAQLPHTTTLEAFVPFGAKVNVEGFGFLCAFRVALLKVFVYLTDTSGLQVGTERIVSK